MCNADGVDIVLFQVAEEVNFSTTGITAAGMKAFDGILQSNVYLKTLNLSGNSIGDEGVKVSLSKSQLLPFNQAYL